MRLRDADQVLLGQRLVTGAVEANNLLIVYPSAEPGFTEFYLIRHGRLAGQQRTESSHDALRNAAKTLLQVASSLGLPPDRVGKAEVDQINIIARWIHQHSDDRERAFFPLPKQLDDPDEVEVFADGLLAAIDALRQVDAMLIGAATGRSDAIASDR